MIVNDEIRKSFQIDHVFHARGRSPASIKAGRCESRKLYVAIGRVHGPEIFEMTKFSEKLTLVRGSGFKIHQNRSLGAGAAAAPD